MAKELGRFITLEGVEGVGKSTNLNFVVEFIQKQLNKKVLVTREPGGTPFAEEIRNLLLKNISEAVHPDTELLLMFAARAQHLQQKILPALQDGKWVICSRFTDSSLAYQGGGRGIDLIRIEELAHWVQGEFQPDLTLLLDLPVEIGLQRAKVRGELDRIEQEELSFFKRVRDQYLLLAQQYADRYQVIDASGSVEDVQAQIRHVLLNKFISG